MFDSGFGSLSIIKPIQRAIKSEIIYFADQKNFPYGKKSKLELTKIITKTVNLLEEKFEPFIKHMNLTSYSVYEEQALQIQKDTIYQGVDIVIGTARRINKLYLMNGINLNDMTTVIIEDANFLPRIDFAKDIVRISEAFEKCQYIVFSTVYDEKLKSLKNSFMYNGVLVEV